MSNDIVPGKINNFIEAFADGMGFEIPEEEMPHECSCGEKFHDGSWMTFEGREYIIECKCWLERASKIMNFLDGHSRAIARYINLEKKRKVAEAAAMPECNE